MRACGYCETVLINAEMYRVRQATKPRFHPHRWQRIGYCCEACHEVEGRPVQFEVGESPPADFKPAP